MRYRRNIILLLVQNIFIWHIANAQLNCENPSLPAQQCAACDFQTGTCGWRDTSSGQSKWERVQATPGDSNPSGAKPPTSNSAGAANGYFMKASVTPSSGTLSTIKMLSPITGPFYPACRMRFKYYIDSTFKPSGRPDALSILSLQLYMVNQTELNQIPDIDDDILIHGKERPLFSSNVPTNGTWRLAIVEVGYMLRTHGFEFRATHTLNSTAVANTNRPEIAIDDIKFEKCTSDENQIQMGDLTCTFNDAKSPWCKYHSETGSETVFYRQNPRSYEWIGPAAEIFGPKTDHAMGSSAGNYLIMHSLFFETGKVARVSSETVKFASPNYKCLTFWYQMYGVDVNQQFSVYQRYKPTTSDKLDRTTLLFRKTQHHGDEWRQVQLNLNVSEDFQVLFEGKVGYNPLNYIAIDDISIYDGDCKFIYYNCEFQTNECGFTNHINNPSTNLWTRTRGFDHSSGSRSGGFMEVKLPGPTEANVTSWLLTPLLDLPDLRPGYCVTFFYKVIASYQGDKVAAFAFLNAVAGNDISLTNSMWLWESQTLSENAYPQQWHMAQVEYRMFDPRKFRIGIVAYHTQGSGGGIGNTIQVDDVLVTPGSCQAMGTCNFENDFCSYWNSLQGPFDFLRTSGNVPLYGLKLYTQLLTDQLSFDIDFYGPKYDHTFQNGLGNYAFSLWLQNFTALDENPLPPSANLTMGSLGSELYLENNTDQCINFYYWLEGKGAYLELWDRRVDRVLRANKLWEAQISSVPQWRSSWVSGKAKVRQGTSTVGAEFKALFSYRAGNALVALDDIIVEYTECSCPRTGTYNCLTREPLLTMLECINDTQVCDFRPDCQGGEDESACGTCDFNSFECGWMLNNNTNSRFGMRWERKTPSGGTPNTDHNNMNNNIVKLTLWDPPNAGLNGVASMLLKDSGPFSPTCQMKFWYHISKNVDPIQGARVEVGIYMVHLNSSKKFDVRTLWVTREDTRSTWEQSTISLTGPLPRGYQIEIRSTNLRTITSEIMPNVAVDDIQFVNCAKQYQPTDCDFERDNCNYLNTLVPWISPLQWKRLQAQPVSVGQGPSTDSAGNTNGYYFAVLGVDNATTSHWAYASSPVIKRHLYEPKCLRFSYHIFGIQTQTFRIWQQYFEITATEPKYRNLVWVRSKAHGNFWKKGQATLYGDEDYVLLLEAELGNDGSHVAIDSISLSNGECPVAESFSCDFEDGAGCNFVNGGTVQEGEAFLIRKVRDFDDLGTTAVDVLPQEDHTSHSEDGHMAVGDLREILPDEHGHILQKLLQTFSMVPPASDTCFRFFYTIGEGAQLVVRVDYGLNVTGDLDYDYDNSHPGRASVIKAPTISWISEIDAELFWHYGQLNIPKTTENIIISVIGRWASQPTEISPRRLVAVDDLSLRTGSCPAPATCNFNNDLCGYGNINSIGIKDPKRNSRVSQYVRNFRQAMYTHRLKNVFLSREPLKAETFATTGLIDWEHSKANNLKPGWAPGQDASGSADGWFVFVRIQGAPVFEEAYFISETVNMHGSTTQTQCLKFRYNIKTATRVTLTALIIEGTVTVSKQDYPGTTVDAWREGLLEVREGLSAWNALFVVSKPSGSSGGWVALDDITLVNGACPFQTTSAQPGSTSSASSTIRTTESTTSMSTGTSTKTSAASASTGTSSAASTVSASTGSSTTAGGQTGGSSTARTTVSQDPQPTATVSSDPMLPAVIVYILAAVAAVLVIVVVILGGGVGYLFYKIRQPKVYPAENPPVSIPLESRTTAGIESEKI